MRQTAIALLLPLLLVACSRKEPTHAEPTRPRAAAPAPATTPAPAPDATVARPPAHVTVDHILIGVKSEQMPSARPAPEAKVLAYRLLKELEAGADWAAMKSQYSDDPPPGGPYSMANAGVTARPGEAKRSGMVKGFGDVAFGLQVGELGIADYDPVTCKYGFHIIKRLK